MSKKNEISPELQALAERMAPYVTSMGMEYSPSPLTKRNFYFLRMGLNENCPQDPVSGAWEFYKNLRRHLDAMGAMYTGGGASLPGRGQAGTSQLIIRTSFKDGALLKAFKKAIKKAKDAEYATPSSRVSATAPAFKPVR